MKGLVKIGSQILSEEGFGSFIIKGFRYVMQFLSIPFCKHKIKNFHPSTYQNALNFAYSKYFGLIKPAQVREEIEDLLDFLSHEKPKTIFEIGTMNGGTLFLFSRIADPSATLISVDLPWGKFGYGYPKVKIPLYKNFSGREQTLHLVRADSHSTSTLEEVRSLLNGREVDFLFLDGDHTYDGVKEDFEMYSSLVRKGGIIGFHDIAPHPPETGCDVYRFWNEVKDKNKDSAQEFVADWNQEWAGVSIIRKNNDKL